MMKVREISRPRIKVEEEKNYQILKEKANQFYARYLTKKKANG
ncbi:MAG: hypothetical protein ACTSX2_05340 [Candidatus Thorarchaeota archaeon]